MLVVTACVLALLLSPTRAAAQSWDALAARGAVIAGIDIDISDVFDVTKPSENTWLGRTANALHARTRRGVVQRELLFAVGDVVNAARIHETERNLRRYAFIHEARLVPVVEPNGQVRVRVDVTDAWSLTPGLTLGRTGGATTWGFHADERNLAGTGKTLGFAYERDRERSTNEITYTDPQLANSRWTLKLRYTDYSDGRSSLVHLERPYFSIETPYAAGAFVRRVNYALTGYHLGDPAFSIPARVDSAAVYASRAFPVGYRTAFRLGAAFRMQDYAYGATTRTGSAPVPDPDTSVRRFRGMSATWAIVQDRPATFRDFASIGQTEDFNLGWSIAGETGYFARRLGAIKSATFGDVAGRKAWRTHERGLVQIDGGASGRDESGLWRNALLRAGMTVYDGRVAGQTFAARVDVAAVTRPDPETWLYLDSTAGLRGYVDHFLAGDRRVVLSVDDRIITRWDLLGVLRVGFVGYADAGAIRRFDTGRWSRTFVDVGGGLRLGRLKGSQDNVVQISVAVPLVGDEARHGPLLVLGNVVRF